MIHHRPKSTLFHTHAHIELTLPCEYDDMIEPFAHCKGGNFNRFISGRCKAISSAKEGKSGHIYQLAKS